MVLTWPMTLILADVSEARKMRVWKRLSFPSPVQIAVREETGAASDRRPTALPAALFMVLQRNSVNVGLVACGDIIRLL